MSLLNQNHQFLQPHFYRATNCLVSYPEILIVDLSKIPVEQTLCN